MDWGSQQSLPPLEVVMFVLVGLVLDFRFGVRLLHRIGCQSSRWPERENMSLRSALVMSVERCSWIGFLQAGSDWTSSSLESYFVAVDI